MTGVQTCALPIYAFLENTELTNIATAAREKTIGLKKVIERIQKQSGYESIKENFTEYKRTELDADTLESLKNRFTIQQFNEELVDLFPYISDLISEETISEGGLAEIGKMLSGKNKMREADAAPKLDMYNVFNKLEKNPKAAQFHNGMDYGDAGYDIPKKYFKALTGVDPTPDALDALLTSDPYGPSWHPNGDVISIYTGESVNEAPKKVAPKVKAAPANVKSTDEPTSADAAAEPIGKVPFIGRAGDDVGDLQNAVKSMGEIRVEPFDKASIIKAMDKTQAQIKELEGNVADNPKDKKMQYALEKAQARLGLLQARLGTADTQTGNQIGRAHV